MKFAGRVSQIQPSQTLGITALVQQLRREGKSVIGLGAGEPDFDTPQEIKDAAIAAIGKGLTKYTPVSGIVELKEAVCEKYKLEAGVDITPAEVLIACGAKHALANAILALCEAGDEIIIPAPYWTSYIEMARFVGATPVVIDTRDDAAFKLSPEQLRESITPRSKLLLLNSPSNPTGSAYSKAELDALVEIALASNLIIVYDEIYEKMLYDGKQHVFLAGYPELRNNLVTVNGVSKTYSMTGWRIGYFIAPPDLVKACNKIQGHTTSNPCSISQYASVTALKSDPAIVSRMVVEFDRRRKYIADALNTIPGVDCLMPDGAFYTYPNISQYIGTACDGQKIESSMDLCNYLLEKVGVALVPGEAFGTTEHVRISYATSMANLEEAVSRMRDGLAKLRAS